MPKEEDSGAAGAELFDRCKDMKIAVMGAGAIGSVLEAVLLRQERMSS